MEVKISKSFPLINKNIGKLKILLFVYGFFLILFSLSPGEIPDPTNRTIDFSEILHFFAYFFFVSIGLFSFLKVVNKKKLVFTVFFLCIFIEVIQFYIPYRYFSIGDIVANILGIAGALFLFKNYL